MILLYVNFFTCRDTSQKQILLTDGESEECFLKRSMITCENVFINNLLVSMLIINAANTK